MVAMSMETQKYWSAATSLWRDPSVRSWILVNPTSIADTWAVCALARSFKETHGGPLTMIMKQSQAPIAEMYAHNIDRILVYEDQQLLSFCWKLYGTGTFDIDSPIVAHPYWHGPGQHFNDVAELFGFPGRGGIKFADWMRIPLRLPWESTLDQPVIPDLWREAAKVYAEEVGLEQGNSVILFPDNNSQPPLPMQVWDDLAAELRKLGKKVFTNMAGNRFGARTEPVAGTHPIQVDLRLAIPLVELAGRFVAMSNGLSSMLTGCKVRAEHTYLILKPLPDEPMYVNEHLLKNPVLIQSQEIIGFGDGPWHEYVIEAGTDYSQVIRDAAANNLDAAFQLFPRR